MIIDIYQPVFDITLKTIQELTSYGNTSLVFPTVREMGGMAADIVSVIRRFNNKISLRVFKDTKQIYQSPPYPFYYYYLDISFDRSQKYMGKKTGKYLPDTKIAFTPQPPKVADPNGANWDTKRRISVTGVNSKNSRLDFSRKNAFIEALEAAGLLPERKNKMSLSFIYGGPFSYFTYLSYQDYSPIFVTGEYSSFPTSSKKEHFTDIKAFKFVSAPVFWFERGMMVSCALDYIAKNISLEKLLDKVEKSPPHRERLTKELKEESIPLAYKFIGAYLKGMEFKGKEITQFFTKVIPPREYCGLYLKPIGRSILHFTFHGSQEELENIIENYNRNHAIPSREKTITIEDIRKANAIQEAKEKRLEEMINTRRNKEVVIPPYVSSLSSAH